MNEMLPETALPCTECQAGHMHRRTLTHFTYLGDELITVPDFPAWVCDMCGHWELDIHALDRLTLVLSPFSEKNRAKRKGLKKTGVKPKRSTPKWPV
jgi:YgiT-type zinc finger domain-containing protein